MLKDTGARVGEACKIKWEDVNVDNKTIRINEPEKRFIVGRLKFQKRQLLCSNECLRNIVRNIFSPNPIIYKNALRVTRNRLSEQLQDP
jgi:integrase